MRPIVAILAACAGCGGGHVGEPDATVATDAASIGVDVATDRGPVHGVLDGDLVEFRGIPYAAPPLDALRFAPPQLHDPWTAPLDATAFGPGCPQAASNDPAITSEDCLTINVWAHADGARRPVIAWIHGGGYVAGASSSPQYDAAQLAHTADVDVVSFNYRLGILGFLALPQVAAADGGIGNWGTRDQIAALQWVQHNASVFGGDPSRVMIAGESAGGVSICTLLAAPSAQGLYAAAAMESGTCRPILEETDPASPPGTLPAAEGLGVVIASKLGCTTGDIAACLRAQTVANVLAAQAALPTYLDLGFPLGATVPVVDKVVIDERPFAAIAAGRGSVPLIVGANHDDESAFVASMGVTNATGQFAAYLAKLPLGGHADDVAMMYPPATFGGELASAIAFDTDLAFACPSLQLASQRTAPTYLYELERGVPNGSLAPYGAVHGLDYVYLFGTFATWGIAPSADDLALSSAMQAAWGALAHGQPPTSTWPLVAGSATPSFMGLAPQLTVETSWRGGRCAQLATLDLLPE